MFVGMADRHVGFSEVIRTYFIEMKAEELIVTYQIVDSLSKTVLLPDLITVKSVVGTFLNYYFVVVVVVVVVARNIFGEMLHSVIYRNCIGTYSLLTALHSYTVFK